MDFKNIGKAIAILRSKRGLSQAQFADACSVGRAQLSRYEAGKELMKLAVLERILKGLALAPADFFRYLESLDYLESLGGSYLRGEIRAHDDSLLIAQACEKLYAGVDNLRQGIDTLTRVIGPAAHLAAMIHNAVVAEDDTAGP